MAEIPNAEHNLLKLPYRITAQRIIEYRNIAPTPTHLRYLLPIQHLKCHLSYLVKQVGMLSQLSL